MRALSLALAGAVAVVSLGFGGQAEAQGRYGSGYVRVGEPLPIRIRPRSWLDAGNVPLTSNVPGAGGSRNPALNPYLIAASNQLTPVYGRNDRFDSGLLPDPITNGPFIGARRSAVTVDLSAVDYLDPTSPLSRARYGF